MRNRLRRWRRLVDIGLRAVGKYRNMADIRSERPHTASGPRMILDILTVLFFVAGFVLLFRLIKQGRRDVPRGPYVTRTGRTAKLTLHSIGPDDYAVIDDGKRVGRIVLADDDPHAEVWLWNCSLPGPGVSSGTAASLEVAQVEFRQEWKKRKIGLQLKLKGK